MPSVAQLQQRGHGDGSKPSAVPTSVSREQEFVSNTICTGGFQSRTCATAAETKTKKTMTKPNQTMDHSLTLFFGEVDTMKTETRKMQIRVWG